MRFIAEQNYWIIDTDSEVIEFSGCDFDGDGVLVSGRFYFQNDVLIGDGIWSKRSEFLKWASRVFRVAKGTMRYSKPLEAYVGKDAELWWRNGGKFAAAVWPGREPAFEKDI
jgi:hypothetical protein